MARTIRREEVAFPSAPDPRFGGNLARATEGAQYSRAFPGGPPGVDRRYENYQAPHRVDYTSSPGTRNFTPPYEGIGRPSFEEQRPYINPRMRGMGGGLGSLQEQAAVDPSDWRTILRILEAGGDPGTETAKAGDWTPSYKDPNFDRQLENLRKMENYWNMPADWEYPPDDLIIDPFNENQLFGHTSKFAARGGLMSLRR